MMFYNITQQNVFTFISEWKGEAGFIAYQKSELFKQVIAKYKIDINYYHYSTFELNFEWKKEKSKKTLATERKNNNKYFLTKGNIEDTDLLLKNLNENFKDRKLESISIVNLLFFLNLKNPRIVNLLFRTQLVDSDRGMKNQIDLVSMKLKDLMIIDYFDTYSLLLRFNQQFDLD